MGVIRLPNCRGSFRVSHLHRAWQGFRTFESSPNLRVSWNEKSKLQGGIESSLRDFRFPRKSLQLIYIEHWKFFIRKFVNFGWILDSNMPNLRNTGQACAASSLNGEVTDYYSLCPDIFKASLILSFRSLSCDMRWHFVRQIYSEIAIQPRSQDLSSPQPRGSGGDKGPGNEVDHHWVLTVQFQKDIPLTVSIKSQLASSSLLTSEPDPSEHLVYFSVKESLHQWGINPSRWLTQPYEARCLATRVCTSWGARRAPIVHHAWRQNDPSLKSK